MAKGELTKEQASRMVKDIARNSYEVGNKRGFDQGKKIGFGYGAACGTLFWAVVVGTVLVLAGCAPVAEVGAGYQVSGNFVGRKPAAHVFMGLETSARGPLSGSCGWYHLSHYFEGTPFNENYETWSDQVLCSVRYSWRDR